MADVWPYVWPIIRRAVDRFPIPDRFTEKELLDLLIKGEMQLWLIEDMHNNRIAAAALTSLIREDMFPDQLVFEVPFVAGYGMKDWIGSLFHLLRTFAVAHGCIVMLGYGRKGWERTLGFQHIGETEHGVRVMARSLTEVH